MKRKYDLCMWTKNGQRWLKEVLQRIDQVIPPENVNQKILVDDHSVDRTVEIAKDFNWTIYNNPSTGISSGANEALRHVETDAFISFEQDLLLHREWFEKVPQHLQKQNVVVASGIRFDTVQGVDALWKWRIMRDKNLGRSIKPYSFGMSLDNTVYKTKFIKALGGFPKLKINLGFDVVLANFVHHAGKHWIVDHRVASKHLRKNLGEILQHVKMNAQGGYYISSFIKKEIGHKQHSKFHISSKTMLCIPIGIYMAIKMKQPKLAYIAPLHKFYWTKGIIKSGGFYV